MSTQREEMMLKRTKEETLERVRLFTDSKIVAEEVALVADELQDSESEYPYWLKEAEVTILGLHDLVMEMYKLLKTEDLEKQDAIQE
jgi:hypothetical protein